MKKNNITSTKDSRGIFNFDHVEKGRTINGEDYALLINRLKDVSTKKLHDLVKKRVFLYQNNAWVHKYYGGIDWVGTF